MSETTQRAGLRAPSGYGVAAIGLGVLAGVLMSVVGPWVVVLALAGLALAVVGAVRSRASGTAPWPWVMGLMLNGALLAVLVTLIVRAIVGV